MALKWFDTRKDVASLYSVDIVIENDGQQIVSWDTPYIMGIDMLDVYRNGIYQQKDVYIEKTETSIEFVEPGYLKKGDIISIRYRPSSINLGNIIVKPTLGALFDVPNPLVNTVAIVTQTKKFYIYGRYGWEEFVIPFTTNNINVLFKYEKQSITDPSQRVYTLQEITYQPGMNSLLVFINGRKVESSSYVEVDNKTILFKEDLPVYTGEIEFMVADTDSWEDSFSHNVEYTYYGDNSIHEEIVKFAGNVVKHTEFKYDAEGNISKEIVTKNGKTIVREYSYDSNGNILNITTTIS